MRAVVVNDVAFQINYETTPPTISRFNTFDEICKLVEKDERVVFRKPTQHEESILRALLKFSRKQ